MTILAIETSCDETAMAVVEASGGLKKPRFKVLKNIVSSQIDVHRQYGGVFPTLAKRSHEKNLPVVLEDLKLSEKEIESIDAFAVTVGPGLEPALWRGIEFAKEFAKKTLPLSSRLFIRNKFLYKKEVKPQMENEDRELLIRFYRNDVEKLQTLLGRNMPWQNF